MRYYDLWHTKNHQSLYRYMTRCGVRAWLITYRMFEIVGDLIERENSDTTNTLNYYQFDETDKYIERKEPIEVCIC